jgi:hypothetical protein
MIEAGNWHQTTRIGHMQSIWSVEKRYRSQVVFPCARGSGLSGSLWRKLVKVA